MHKFIWGTESNNHKSKVWVYLKVRICKFSTAGNLILIFIERALLPSRTIWSLQEVSHFSNECYYTVYIKSALDFVGKFFLKNDIAEMGGQKNSGLFFHGWCHGIMATSS